MNEFLLDRWSSNGSDEKGLFDTIKELDERTYVQKVNTSDIGILSMIDFDDATGNISVICSMPLVEKRMKLVLNKNTFLKNGLAPEGFYDEFTNSGFALYVNKEIIFASTSLIGTLMTRADLAGFGMFSPSPERDLFLTKRFAESPQTTSLIIREPVGKGFKKAYAALSGNYKYIPQSVLKDIINDVSSSMGQTDYNYYRIDNNMTEIYVEFPEKADDVQKTYNLKDSFVPGLYIRTSDVGDSSLTIKGTYRLGKARASFGEFSRVHRGDIDISSIVTEVNKKVFVKYNALPEALVKLMGIDIPQPEITIKDTAKAIGLVKAIGKKFTKSLVNALIDELNPSLSYTAYDIAIMFLGLSERCNLNVNALRLLETAVTNVAFIDFEKLNIPTVVTLNP